MNYHYKADDSNRFKFTIDLDFDCILQTCLVRFKRKTLIIIKKVNDSKSVFQEILQQMY